jgi:hypothetical protein
MGNHQGLGGTSMNTQEHLNQIKAKCQELLAIAEKRTAGEWEADGIFVDCLDIDECVASATTVDEDATFIASCAGAAEAGWKATIAAIDELTALNDESCLYDGHEGQHTHRLRKIIAAWPQELL